MGVIYKFKKDNESALEYLNKFLDLSYYGGCFGSYYSNYEPGQTAYFFAPFHEEIRDMINDINSTFQNIQVEIIMEGKYTYTNLSYTAAYQPDKHGKLCMLLAVHLSDAYTENARYPLPLVMLTLLRYNDSNYFTRGFETIESVLEYNSSSNHHTAEKAISSREPLNMELFKLIDDPDKMDQVFRDTFKVYWAYRDSLRTVKYKDFIAVGMVWRAIKDRLGVG